MKNKQVDSFDMLSSEYAEAQPSAILARFGHVLAIQESMDTVRVDFDGNPYSQGLTAKLGRLFTSQELNLAIENKLTCRIEFVGGDIHLPVVTDIFFSLVKGNGELKLKASSIIIEAEQELTLKSGCTSSTYSGRDGRLTSSAKYITTQAEKAQQIRGSTISIN